MEPKKIDEALQRAVNTLVPERNAKLHSDNLLELISMSNEDSKKFAVKLVQETLHELLDDPK